MIKINELQLENVKRIKAVKIEPTLDGLTVIGGKNGQGKTSVLDSIAWVLGGDKFRPSTPERIGSVIPPDLHIEMSNGLIVERKGKNSSLKVIDPNGNKGGQQILNSFVEQLALNLPKFMESSNKDKADTLLKIIGVGDKLAELETKERELYNRRYKVGRIADQKLKFAQEMPEYLDAPKELVSISVLIQEQQTILAKNGENQKKRNEVRTLTDRQQVLLSKKAELENKLADVIKELDEVETDLNTAAKSTEDLQDESTAEIEESIANIEKINMKVRANNDKEKAFEDEKIYREQYKDLSVEIDTIRDERLALLNNAELPLDGLSVKNGELTYNNLKWDNMSGSEQLKVSTAIVRKLNPECGFVLLDKLEQMDVDTLNEFGEWASSEGLQVIATRVSTGDECSIIIEDGYVKAEQQKQWKAGEF